MRSQISVSWLILVGVVMSAVLIIGYILKNNVLTTIVAEEEAVSNFTV